MQIVNGTKYVRLKSKGPACPPAVPGISSIPNTAHQFVCNFCKFKKSTQEA